MIGHLSSAAGTYEAIAVVLSLRRGLIPPNAADLELDPSREIPVVSDSSLPFDPGPILSNSFGLGGVNCSLIIAPV